MDKTREIAAYERKLIAYEKMIDTYWEIIYQVMNESITSLEYFKLLKGVVSAALYYNTAISSKKSLLEDSILELAKARVCVETKAYDKAYRDVNKTFNDLIIAIRADMEGEKL